MDFNFDTGSIYNGIQFIDPTILPPLGGQAGVLTINGTGALSLPSGTTLQQPSPGVGGMLRYNSAGWLEFYDAIATTWQVLSYASGSVASFSLNDNSATPIYTTTPTTSATGAISASITLTAQSANTVFAGPATGSPAQPTFRTLVAADIPPVTNLAGGLTGNIVYQSAPDTTAFLGNGTANYVLTSNGIGAAPSYTAVVNSFSTGSSGITVNASTGSVSINGGQLVVGYGGTGLSTLTLNGVVYGNATSAAGVTAAGSQFNVLTVNALGVPVFGQVDLAQSGISVTGNLPLANGGTNSNLAGSNGSIVYNNGTSLVNSSVGTINQALISGGASAPTWTTVSSTITTNQILQGDGTGAFVANGGSFIGSGSFSGITLSGAVTNSTDAVTKSYVDALVTGLDVHGAVETTDISTEITGAPGLVYTPGVAGQSPDAGAGVGATLSGTGTIPIIGGYTIITPGVRVLIKMFNSGIYSLGTIAPGSLYTDGTYTLVPLTGGTGTGAQSTIIVAGGLVTSVVITSNGIGYSIGDVLGVNNSGSLGGTGTGFNIPVVNLQNIQNGVYVSTMLTGGWVLTRATDYNNSRYGSVKAGAFLYVSEGTSASTGWTQTSIGSQLPGDCTKIGVDSIVYTQFSGAGTYLAGAGLSLGMSGTQFNVNVDGVTTHINGSNQLAILSSSTSGQSLLSTGSGNTPIWGALPLGNTNAVTGILGTVSGGSGLDTSTAANGALLIGNGLGLTLATLTQGTGITINNAVGAITISNAGVTSFNTGSTGLTPNTATTGAVTLAGTLVVENGGTGVTSLTTNGVLYGGATVGTTSVGTTGQVLVGNTGSAPSWSSLSSIGVTTFRTTLLGLTPSMATSGALTLSGILDIGSGGTGQTTNTSAFDALSPLTTTGDIIYFDGTNNIRLAVGTTGQVLTVVTGAPGWTTLSTEAVTTFSAGTTGFTPTTATTGAVTLSGTLNVSNGGTGASATPSNGQLLIGNGTAFSVATLGAGSGISTTVGTGTLQLNNTGVLSVSLNDTSSNSIYNTSPLTATTGVVATTIALKTQSANVVFAGPSTGSAVEPTFRSLAYADLPIQLYVENPMTPVAPTAAGTNAIAIGSGASAPAVSSFAVGTGATARIYGQKAYANGSFAITGDAQHGIYILRQQTSNAFGQTSVEMFLDGNAGIGTQQIVMPNNSVFMFDILVAARRTDAVGGGAAYRFVGAARKDSTDGSTTFIGTPSKTVVGETDVSWDANVAINTASGAGGFTIRVTGETAKSINWVATVSTSEVTN